MSDLILPVAKKVDNEEPETPVPVAIAYTDDTPPYQDPTVHEKLGVLDVEKKPSLLKKIQKTVQNTVKM